MDREPLTHPEIVLERLADAHGPLEAPTKRPPLDELVRTILSQNTSDTNSDRAFAALLDRFDDWDAVADASVAEVEEAIRSGGLAQQKAPRIRSALRDVRQHRGEIDLDFLAELPDGEALAFLESMDGVGPKTAACVLAFSLERPVIPVDTHVHRVSRRLGLIGRKTSAAKAHAELEAVVAPEDRIPLHVALIRHGRTTCKARSPRCDDCVLGDVCPRVGVA